MAKLGVAEFNSIKSLLNSGLSFSDFSLPIPEEWSLINVLPTEQIKPLLHQLNQASINQEQINTWENGDDEDKEKWAYIGEYINQLKANLVYCLEHQISLCVFAH